MTLICALGFLFYDQLLISFSSTVLLLQLLAKSWTLFQQILKRLLLAILQQISLFLVTLMHIILNGLPSLMELIFLVNIVTVLLSLMTLNRSLSNQLVYLTLIRRSLLFLIYSLHQTKIFARQIYILPWVAQTMWWFLFLLILGHPPKTGMSVVLL